MYFQEVDYFNCCKAKSPPRPRRCRELCPHSALVFDFCVVAVLRHNVARACPESETSSELMEIAISELGLLGIGLLAVLLKSD